MMTANSSGQLRQLEKAAVGKQNERRRPQCERCVENSRSITFMLASLKSKDLHKLYEALANCTFAPAAAAAVSDRLIFLRLRLLQLTGQY